MSKNLDTFLEGIETEMSKEETIAENATVETEEVKDETTEDVKEEAVAENATTEDSPSESKEEDSSKMEQTEKEDPKQVPLKALEEERHKRQELERQLEALKNPPKEEEQVEFFEDPEGRFNQMQQQVNTQMLVQKIQMSEYMAKQQYADYDDKMQRFLEEAQKSPALIDQMKSHTHPAEFAYQTADKFIKMDEIDNLDAYKQSLSEKLRKELEEEYKAKYEGKKAKAGALPKKSLADTGSAKLDTSTKEIDVDAFISGNGWKPKK